MGMQASGWVSDRVYAQSDVQYQVRNVVTGEAIEYNYYGWDKAYAKAIAKAWKYTPKKLAWLREHCKGRKWKEVAVDFNATFGTNVKAEALQKRCNVNGIFNGVVFVPTLHGIQTPPPVPMTRPIGAERIDKKGRVVIKTALPRKWELKHEAVWRATHGAIPKGHI
ncbi:MAG: hypothetical protein FWD76_02725 [Firmicutes bacterium]|nr:hypothetical protein [Bacillota bacterium]